MAAYTVAGLMFTITYTPLILRHVMGLQILVSQVVFFSMAAVAHKEDGPVSLPLYVLLFFTVLRYIRVAFMVSLRYPAALNLISVQGTQETQMT